MPSLSEINTRMGAVIRIDQVTYVKYTERGGVYTVVFGLPSGDYLLRTKLSSAVGELNEFFNSVSGQSFDKPVWKVPAEIDFELVDANTQ